MSNDNTNSSLDSFWFRVSEIMDQAPTVWAAKIGLSGPGVMKWKNNGAIPEGRVLVKIHEKTGVSINWLLLGKGPKFLKSQNSEEGLVISEGARSQYPWAERCLEEIEENALVETDQIELIEELQTTLQKIKKLEEKKRTGTG